MFAGWLALAFRTVQINGAFRPGALHGGVPCAALLGGEAGQAVPVRHGQAQVEQGGGGVAQPG
jgi:hypothetical protein